MPERIHKAKGLEKEFVILRNKDLQRTDLSYEAIGMLAYLMSLPEEWVIYVSALKRKGTGRDAIKRIISELIEAGYLHVEQGHDESGKFTANDYHAYAMPEYNPHFTPLTENPLTAQPSTVNPQLKRKEEEESKDKDSVASSKPRAAKPFYDAISLYTKLEGALNTNLEKMLSGKATDAQHKPYNLDPAVSLDEFIRWAKYWRKQNPELTFLQSPAKIQSSILAWRKTRKSADSSAARPAQWGFVPDMRSEAEILAEGEQGE